MHLKTIYVIAVLSTFASNNVNAQNSIEITPLSGIKIFSPGSIPLEGKSYGAEIAYNIYQKENPAEWIKKLRIRDISIVAGYRDMRQVYIKDSVDSKGFLKDVYTISGRLNINLLNVNKTELLFITGFGATFTNTSYYTDKNPLVGSRINFSPQAGIKLKTPLSGSTSVIAGADIFHYSNIGLRVPNNGVNTFALSLGLISGLKNTRKDWKKNIPDSLRGFFEIGADIGYRGAFKTRAGTWKSGIYAGYNYKINHILSLKFGSDAVYYYTPFTGSIETFQYYATSYDRWRIGVGIGGDIWLGKLAVMGNYGYYLKYNSYYPVKWYWTAGLKYYINSWLGFQGKMYSHKSQADYLGFGLIFRFGTMKFK